MSLARPRRLPRARRAEERTRDLGDGGRPSSSARVELVPPPTTPTKLARRAREARRDRRRADRLFYVADAMRVGDHRRRAPRAHRDRPLVPRADPRASSAPRGRCEQGELGPAQICAATSASASATAQHRDARRRDARTRSARSASARASAPVYARVDTCAAEFVAHTPYLYSTYETESESRAPTATKQKVVILGGGPNRIGQGIEFDYCCVHAVHGAARARVRDHHGQLQPRDGVDRLRHVATASTSSRSRSRTCSPSCDEEKPERRHRAVRRADAAEARGAAREARA